MRILVVAANKAANQALLAELARKGASVDDATTGEDALDAASSHGYDVILMDLALPDMGGCDALRRMRAARIDTPVVMKARSAPPQTRAQAFNIGADDFVDQLCDLDECIARLRSAARRGRGIYQPVQQVGEATLDLQTKTVRVGDATVPLTPKEYAVFELMATRRGTPLTKDAFLDHLYRDTDEPYPKLVDVFVCKIRKKLALMGVRGLVRTIQGRGYCIDRDRDRGAAPRPTAPTRHHEVADARGA